MHTVHFAHIRWRRPYQQARSKDDAVVVRSKKFHHHHHHHHRLHQFVYCCYSFDRWHQNLLEVTRSFHDPLLIALQLHYQTFLLSSFLKMMILGTIVSLLLTTTTVAVGFAVVVVPT